MYDLRINSLKINVLQTDRFEIIIFVKKAIFYKEIYLKYVRKINFSQNKSI